MNRSRRGGREGGREAGKRERGGTKTGGGEIILACSASGVRAGRAAIVKEGHAKKTDGLLPSSTDSLIKVGEGDNRLDGGPVSCPRLIRAPGKAMAL